MTRTQLSHLLASIVTASLGASPCACEPCPYTETVRSFNVQIDGATACALMADAYGAREAAPAPSAEACAAACNDPEVNSCSVDSAYQQAYFGPDLGSGGAGGGSATGKAPCPAWPTTATLSCEVTESHGSYHDGCPIAGRRPEALDRVSPGDGSAAAWLARAAHLEAASVFAFRLLEEDLAALGAPEDLLSAVRDAAADEVRHAEVMGRLCRARGTEPPAAVVGARAHRPVEAIALENAVEGMVRETFGAALAIHQGRRAADPEVAAALAAIAEDECAHAALSFRVGAFLGGLLDAGAEARIEDAKRAAIGDLIAEIEAPLPAGSEALGLPERAVARRMLAMVEDQLWAAPMAA